MQFPIRKIVTASLATSEMSSGLFPSRTETGLERRLQLPVAELHPDLLTDLHSANFSSVKELQGGCRVSPLTNITFKSINGMAFGWILTVKWSREKTNIF